MEKHKTETRSKKNIYFLHIPKCGGVSLKSSIRNSLTDDDVFGFGHRPYNQIQDPEEKFIFTFVRNPWDRIVSLYSFWKNQDEGHRHYKFDKEQVDFIQNNNIKFDDFVKQIRDRHPIFMKKGTLAPTWVTFSQNQSTLISSERLKPINKISTTSAT